MTLKRLTVCLTFIAVCATGPLVVSCGDSTTGAAAHETHDAGAVPDVASSAPETGGSNKAEASLDATAVEAATQATLDATTPEAMADSAPEVASTVTVYDLKTDWSDTKNPNGVWSLREGVNVITPSVANWNGYKGQFAWAKSATGSGHIPVLVKVAVAGFEAPQAQIGDLIIHAQDEFGGPGLGQAQIVWTAPASGTVDIKGALWLGRTSLGRSDDWTLTVAGVQKSTGKVGAADGHDRANPWKLSETQVPVSLGQTVTLQISRSAACSDARTCAEFCGVLLTVTLTSP